MCAQVVTYFILYENWLTFSLYSPKARGINSQVTITDSAITNDFRKISSWMFLVYALFLLLHYSHNVRRQTWRSSRSLQSNYITRLLECFWPHLFWFDQLICMVCATLWAQTSKLAEKCPNHTQNTFLHWWKYPHSWGATCRPVHVHTPQLSNPLSISCWFENVEKIFISPHQRACAKAADSNHNSVWHAIAEILFSFSERSSIIWLTIKINK